MVIVSLRQVRGQCISHPGHPLFAVFGTAGNHTSSQWKPSAWKITFSLLASARGHHQLLFLGPLPFPFLPAVWWGFIPRFKISRRRNMVFNGSEINNWKSQGLCSFAGSHDLVICSLLKTRKWLVNKSFGWGSGLQWSGAGKKKLKADCLELRGDEARGSKMLFFNPN